MEKHLGAAGVFLRILLSFALAVSFVPLVRDEAVADSGQSEVSPIAQDTQAGQDLQIGQSTQTGQDVQNAQDVQAGQGVQRDEDAQADENTQLGQISQFDQADQGLPTEQAAQSGSSAAGNSGEAESSPAQSGPVVYEYGVRLSNGYVYESDAAGNPIETPNEDDPYLNSIDGTMVKHLIVASDVTEVPVQFCGGSNVLETVEFKTDALVSIGERAFYLCSKLSSISFPCITDVTIGSIGKEAFYGCGSLTSFRFDKLVNISSLGESCFANSGLVSTGLDRVRGLTSIPDFAYDNCRNLTETCLDKNQEIESIGARAFSWCGNLRVTGLEGNTSIASLGVNCFADCDLSGGLVLPRDSKITLFPEGAFSDTKLDQVLFLCDHAVKINSYTFPERLTQIMVPDSLIAYYETPDVERNYEYCYPYTPPTAISKCLTAMEVVQDPTVMAYTIGRSVSLDGMRISFTLGGKERVFDAVSLESDFVLGRFIDIAPTPDGAIFDESAVGQFLNVRYNDGSYFLEAYSSAPLREAGSQNPLVSIKKVGAAVDDLVDGAGRYTVGETCLVHATASSNPNRTFAYWMDEQGTILSEQQAYEFEVTQDIVLYAVYANKVTIRPQARLGSNKGEPISDVTFSVIADGVNQGSEFSTYEGKHVQIACAYDASKYTLSSWLDLDDGFYLNYTYLDDTIGYEARAGRTPVAVFDQSERTSCEVAYSQSIDLGGRELMDGVSLPNVEGSVTASLGKAMTLDASALGMADENIAFVGWFNADTNALLSSQTAYTFMPTRDVRVQARFALKSTAVRVMPAQSTDCSEEYAHLAVTEKKCYRDAGESVTLAAAADNAQFLGWYTGAADESCLYSDALACSYIISEADAENGSVDITPWYCAQKASVVLSVGETTEDGEPAGQFLTTGLYGIGSRVTVCAIPAAGYVFDSVTDAQGNVVSTAENGTSYTFVLTEDTQLVAHFRLAETDDEALIALKTALVAVIGALMVVGTVYGAGAVVDPIGTEAIIEIEAAANIEEVAEVGKEVIKELEEIIERAKHDRDPNKPRPESNTVEIAVHANPEAGGIVRGGGVHHEGTVAELEAIPNPGYRFVCWKEDGVERSRSPLMTLAVTDATPRVVAMTAVFERDAAITTAIEVEGAADIATGCNATPDRQTVERGTEAVVVATEGADYAFVGWFENGVEVSKAKTYAFLAEADRHLVAKFRKASRSIVVASEPVGSADILCNGVPVEDGLVKAEDGDLLTFTAKPGARPDDSEKTYKLVEWRESSELGPDIVNRQDVCEYRVNGNARIIAVMDGKDAHTARVVAEPAQGGEVLLEQGEKTGVALEIPAGESATAIAKAAEGYIFDGWYLTYGTADVASSLASMDSSYTFTPLADCTVSAHFQRMCEVNVAVEPAAALAGKYTVQGEGTYAQGQRAILSVELDSSIRDEFDFEGWYRADCGLLMGTDPSYLEFVPEDDSTTIRAQFRAKEYTISAKARTIFKERGTVEIEGHPGADSVTAGWGDTVTLKAHANDGYKLKHWISSTGKKYTDAELAVRVTKDESYTAVFEKWYPEVVIAADSWFGGTVSCNGQEITAETSMGDAFKLGDTLHLSAEPRVGWVFWGWYVNGLLASVSREYDIKAEGSFGSSRQCVVTAAFKPVDVLCVPVASPSEGGSVQASRIVTDRGEEVALKATAAPGYAFVGWYKDGVELESEEPEFTHREAASCVHVAKFEKRSYSVSATAMEENDAGELAWNGAAGWVEGAASIDAGCAAELSAHALPGYAFDRWIDGEGNVVSRDETCRFVPSQDTTLVAVFAAKRFIIDISAVQGYGNVSGGGTYEAGQTVVAHAVPNEDSVFLGWYSAGVCVSTSETYRFAARCDMALEAVFELGPCAVRAQASPVDAGYVSGFGGFNEGERTTLRAVAKTGFTFDYWKDAQGNVVGESPELTVVAEGEAMYTACFARNSYEVDLASSVEGVGVLSGGGTYEFGQLVEINAQQTNDKRFVGWYLVDSEGNKSLFRSEAHCWFALDEDLARDLDDDTVALRAEFADPYDVSVGASVVVNGKTGTRGCKVSGGGVFQAGESVTLSAVCGLGYRFVGWSTDKAGESIVETNAAFSFTATQDTSYYALFEVDGRVEITVSQSSILRGKAFLAGDLDVGGSGSFDKGDTFVAMAVSWPGYHFSHWIDDAGAIASYSAIYVGIACENKQLTAVFYESSVDVQVATYPSGSAFSMVIPGTGSKYKSAAVLVTIPYPGWKFKYWVDENAAPIGFSTVLIRPTLQNRTFTAYYEKIEPVDPDPDNPEPDNPSPDPDPDPGPGPGPSPDPDNPDPDPNPDPDNPNPSPDPDNPSGPVDPDNPDNPGPSPDPDNPGPGPDPDTPGPNPGPDNPDPKPDPDPDNPQPSPEPDPDNPEPSPDPEPDNPEPDNPTPGPAPDPGPDNPDGPTDPSNPDNPGPAPDPEPGNPDGPSDPDNPSGPTDPSNPDNPGDPTGPDGPNKPDPGNPDGPSPDNPGKPTGPTDPTKPDSPDGPSNPSGPVGPADPADPVGPAKPNSPVRPVGPGGPVGPSGPNSPVAPGAGVFSKVLDGLGENKAVIQGLVASGSDGEARFASGDAGDDEAVDSSDASMESADVADAQERKDASDGSGVKTSIGNGILPGLVVTALACAALALVAIARRRSKRQ